MPSQLQVCELVLGNKVRVWCLTIDTEKFKQFGACSLDFDPMTLVCELDLDVAVTYLHAKNEISRLRVQKLLSCYKPYILQCLINSIV